MDDIITRLIALPVTVKGTVVKDAEGDYNVYLNQDLSEDEQRKAYAHELRHISFDHLHSDKPVIVMEHEAEYKK